MQVENQPATLGDIVISPEDFARTYMRNWMFDAYLVTAQNPDLLPAQVATRAEEERGLKNHYGVMRSVIRWRESLATPLLVKGLVRLHLAGVFPGKHGYRYDAESENMFMLHCLDGLDYKNPNFVALCLLASMQYWKGTLYRISRRDANGFSAAIGVDSQDPLFASIEKLVNALGGQLADTEKVVEPAIISMEVSRMMYLLSNMSGAKSTSKRLLPDYVHRALDTLHLKACTADERCVALQILKDFVMCFLALKCHLTHTGTLAGMLISSRDRTLVDEGADDFMHILEHAEIDIPFATRVKGSAKVHERMAVSTFPYSETMLKMMRYGLKGRIEEVLEKRIK